MIGYVCKYTPIEIFTALGVETSRIEPDVTNFDQADTLMHPNMCSYTKAVLEDSISKDYEGIVLTTCCDSIRRLFDILKEQYPDKFIYLLDVPRKVNDFSISIYVKRILEMVEAYEDYSGKRFDKEELFKLFDKQLKERKLEENQELKNVERTEEERQENKINIGLMGARCSKGILELLKKSNVNIVFNLTCTGLNRDYVLVHDNILFSYASNLLNQFPCMRMQKATNRENYLEGLQDEINGIIYHTVKFCDNYSYEYTHLKEVIKKPILKIETDYTKQCAGQIRTRVEAFIESLEVTANLNKKRSIRKNTGDDRMYVLGIDSGSTSTNAVILNEKKEIVAFHVVRTGAKSGESAERILEEVLAKANMKREDIDTIISTGYGRVSIPFADQNVTEISCHGKGANYLNPKIRTILDIGGQDSKVIKLNDKGEVIDFVMNDKCAAGTGRFLEMMARTLEIDISELGPISLDWKEDIDISSMCSVFAESEVISLIALNKEKSDIAHGIHKAIATKSYSLLKRVGLEGEYMMTGGVAKNPGVVKAVEEKIQDKLFISKEPEIVGAIGAALFGLE
ncbi:acyl-CoA dehydratase activase [Anaeromicropila herbilytica]|uniref:Bifunctional 2-hydroxyacyl-CoA dehydratase/activator domain-containing protein n=1 Tax=Anaeromicropila herbilytica TaxID=2785025 RepID=A0A7R7EMB7_9FIRM|nr:acyl-CoA dehydratase activase [Anaeromicropila herbilytica]BCN31142.1 bifunctional 2-hydroxyacyl-CoA dehydratase/activator domain-containing protein [Anaeromicropila herbilytica]